MPASLSFFAATHQRARAHTHRLNDKKCGVGMRGRVVVTLSLITSEANKADKLRARKQQFIKRTLVLRPPTILPLPAARRPNDPHPLPPRSHHQPSRRHPDSRRHPPSLHINVVKQPGGSDKRQQHRRFIYTTGDSKNGLLHIVVPCTSPRPLQVFIFALQLHRPGCLLLLSPLP